MPTASVAAIVHQHGSPRLLAYPAVAFGEGGNHGLVPARLPAAEPLATSEPELIFFLFGLFKVFRRICMSEDSQRKGGVVLAYRRSRCSRAPLDSGCPS